MKEGKLCLKCIFNFLFFIIFFLVCMPLASAEVIYDNPLEDQYGKDLEETSLQQLLEDASQEPVDTSVAKAQYLLGLVYLNGDASWEVESDLEKGKHYLIKAWENSVADAGYTLAIMYYKGAGVKRDNVEALKYLERSSEMGFLLSQRELGKAYLGTYDDWGDLVPQDIPRGLCWLESAAESGDIKSARALAKVYLQGDLVDQDYEQAFLWTQKWAESKYGVDLNAFLRLAKSYEEGLGVERDLVQAYKYYDLTSPSGDDDKERVANEMTQEQIDEAVRQSRAWQEEHNTFVPSYDGLEYQEDGSFR